MTADEFIELSRPNFTNEVKYAIRTGGNHYDLPIMSTSEMHPYWSPRGTPTVRHYANAIRVSGGKPYVVDMVLGSDGFRVSGDVFRGEDTIPDHEADSAVSRRKYVHWMYRKGEDPCKYFTSLTPNKSDMLMERLARRRICVKKMLGLS